MKFYGTVVRDDGAHFAGELAEIAGKEALVLPIETRWAQELLAVEIGADSHLDAFDVLHQDEALRFIELWQGCEECDDVVAVGELTDEGFRDLIEFRNVAARVLANKRDGACPIRERFNGSN